MTNFSLQTPVALLCFNRPAETASVMQAIRAARPPRLHMIADGPRSHIADDAARCAEVRAIATEVDWPCEVVTDFAGTNMGLRQRVASGLDAAFRRSEELIVLEDDCVPHAEFFRFCQELLARYRDDDRVFAITGDNFQSGPPRTPYSYYFSQIFHCWGWASWRRVWQSIDMEMRQWPEIRDGGWLEDSLADRQGVAYWRAAFDRTYRGENNSWAYRASFASLSQGRVNILPATNLVQNIGIGNQATHTGRTPGHGAPEARPLGFPLRHPPHLIVDRKADGATYARMNKRSGKKQGPLRHIAKIMLGRQ